MTAVPARDARSASQTRLAHVGRHRQHNQCRWTGLYPAEDETAHGRRTPDSGNCTRPERTRPVPRPLFFSALEREGTRPERNKLGPQITTREYIRSENLSKPLLYYLVRSEIRSAFLEGIEKPSGPGGRRGSS